MIISLIASVTENRIIGNGNNIPWKISGEQLKFKEITEGHTVIMGRKTYESIGHALPYRNNIIVTSQSNYTAKDCIVVESLGSALGKCKDYEEVFIIGGQRMFEQALDIANKIYLSVIHKKFDGDKFFPKFSEEEFNEVYTEYVKGEISYTFKVFERVKFVGDFGLGPFKHFK